jgi:carboxypeptidase D
MDGMFLENGPLRFDISQSPPPLVLNEKGWWKEMNIVYVDNPPGTGYSLGPYYTSSKQVSDNFLLFLNEFMEIFPEYSDADIYLAGESFAGVWIPQIARSLLANKKKVKSLLLGSPWIDSANQYPSNFEYSKILNLIPPGKWMDLVGGVYNGCLEELKETSRTNTITQCERIMDTVLEASEDGGQFCINKYDYRLRDKGYVLSYKYIVVYCAYCFDFLLF